VPAAVSFDSSATQMAQDEVSLLLRSSISTSAPHPYMR
jgi:hypothetical protein